MLERYNDLGAFDDLTGEPRVKLANFYKLAAVNEIADFISKFKPDPKFLYIHVIAMGAGEFYGCNKNGDYFPERSLIAYHKTFETNAKVFKEHNNKPTSPSYGFVPISWYNPEMHRVELILAIDKEKAPDVVQQVEAGGTPIEVSMGCFVAGTEITLADGTTKLIEQVVEGDVVLTHLGNTRIVTDTMQRKYRGNFYELSVSGLAKPIKATEEHPFWVRRFGYKRKSFKEGWVLAKDIRIGDFVSSPKPITVEAQGDLALAKILGYYIAEGNIMKYKGDPREVEFTFNITEDSYVQDLTEAFHVVFPEANVRLYSRPTKSITVVRVHNERIARELLRLGGEYCASKKLANEVMTWSPEVQMELLNTYINGDGTWNKVNKNISWTTCSKDLNAQLVTICARNSIATNTVFIPENTYQEGRQSSYVTTINSIQCNSLRSKLAKIPNDYPFKTEWLIRNPKSPANFNIVKVGRGQSFFDGDVLYRRVTKVTETTEEMLVYNFSVAGDESYIAGSISAHNCRVQHDVCSICGNKSSKKSEYCDHIRYHNKEVFPDGRQAYMLNLTPKFFDISIVRRRADRIAYMLSKVASEDGLELSHIHDVVEAKLAAIDKRIPAMAVIGKLNKGYHNLLPAIEASEPDLPPAMLDRMALTHDIPTILSSFLHSAIPMKPKEYARVVVINLGMPVQTIPDVLAGMSQAPRYNEMQLPPFSSEILGMLGQYLNQRSAFGPCVRRRVEALGPILKLASFPDVDPYSVGAAPMPLYYSSGSKIPVTYQYNAIPAQVMAEQYYQRAQTAKNVEPFSIGVLLGKLFKSSHEPQTLSQLARSLNASLTKVACDLGSDGLEMLQELQKTAGIGGKILGYGVAPFVGAHMVAAHSRRKFYQGQELSSVEQFAAENPDYLGVAAPVALIGAKKMLFKRAGEDDLETKIANFADVLSDSAVQGLIFRAKGVSGGGGITDMVLDNVLWHHIGDKLKGSQANQPPQTPPQTFKPQY